VYEALFSTCAGCGAFFCRGAIVLAFGEAEVVGLDRARAGETPILGHARAREAPNRQRRSHTTIFPRSDGIVIPRPHALSAGAQAGRADAGRQTEKRGQDGVSEANRSMGFAYRVAIGWDIFLLSGAALLMLTIVTVGMQALGAALANPIKALRSE